MKSLLALTLSILCLSTLAASPRTIKLEDSWQLLYCKQNDDGVTIQRRHYGNELDVSIIAYGDSKVTYEIWFDGAFKTSCDHITVRNTMTAGSSL